MVMAEILFACTFVLWLVRHKQPYFMVYPDQTTWMACENLPETKNFSSRVRSGSSWWRIGIFFTKDPSTSLNPDENNQDSRSKHQDFRKTNRRLRTESPQKVLTRPILVSLIKLGIDSLLRRTTLKMVRVLILKNPGRFRKEIKYFNTNAHAPKGKSKVQRSDD